MTQNLRAAVHMKLVKPCTDLLVNVALLGFFKFRPVSKWLLGYSIAS